MRAAKDIVVFRSGPLRSAPLQNPKDFGFGRCYQTSPRCRRCEPEFLAASSLIQLANASFLKGIF
jgi:hypothetical protein